MKKGAKVKENSRKYKTKNKRAEFIVNDVKLSETEAEVLFSVNSRETVL